MPKTTKRTFVIHRLNPFQSLPFYKWKAWETYYRENLQFLLKSPLPLQMWKSSIFETRLKIYKLFSFSQYLWVYWARGREKEIEKNDKSMTERKSVDGGLLWPLLLAKWYLGPAQNFQSKHLARPLRLQFFFDILKDNRKKTIQAVFLEEIGSRKRGKK